MPVNLLLKLIVFVFVCFSGVPHSSSDLLTFLSEVRNQYQENDPNAERPLLVHCR